MNKQQQIVANVNTAIIAITAASKIVRKNVQIVSDDFLTLNHIGGLDRIPFLATRMVGAMTALDGKGFKHFVSTMFPLVWSDETKCFDMIENEEVRAKAKVDAKLARDNFLEEFQNNYWLWVTTKVTVEKKEIDWVARLDSAMVSVMADEKGGLSLDDVLLHVIEKQGLNLDTFLRILAPKTVIDVAEQNDILMGELEQAA